MVIIGASFNGPPILAPVLQEKTGWTRETSETVAQLVCPGLAQVFATPLHILGLDMYNRPTVSWSEHCKGLLRRTLDPLGVRMCRQIYVFGVGSIAIRLKVVPTASSCATTTAASIRRPSFTFTTLRTLICAKKCVYVVMS